YFAAKLELRRSLLERHDSAWEQAAEKFGAGSLPKDVSYLITSYLDGVWSEMEWMEHWRNERIETTMAPGRIVQQLMFGRRAHACGDFERAWREVYDQLPQG